MKKLFILLLLLAAQNTYSQLDHNVYFDFSIDPNKAFGIIDNPRTEVDNRGIDWDIEAGLMIEQVSLKWYIYYGEFQKINWTNYGMGMDYYLAKGDYYDIAAGLQINFIDRLMMVYKESGEFAFYADYSSTSIGFGSRITGVIWVIKNLGISGRFQYITRPDLKEQFGIFEGSIGLTYKLEL